MLEAQLRARVIADPETARLFEECARHTICSVTVRSSRWEEQRSCAEICSPLSLEEGKSKERSREAEPFRNQTLCYLNHPSFTPAHPGILQSTLPHLLPTSSATCRMGSFVSERAQRSREGAVRKNGRPKGCFWRVRFFSAPLRVALKTVENLKGQKRNGLSKTTL